MLLSTGPPSRRSKLLHGVMVAAIIFLLLHTARMYNYRQFSKSISNVDLKESSGVSDEDQYLERLLTECELTKQLSWTALRLHAREQSYTWQAVTGLQTNFGAIRSRFVDTAGDVHEDVRARKKMDMPVPQSPLPGTVDASDILFGVTSTFDRVRENDFAIVRAWARWLTNGRRSSNGASLVVMLDQAHSEQVDEVDRKMADFGIDAYVTATEEPMSLARRYYELARILKTFGVNLKANGQNKRWFALIEDNVFFPSLSYLLDRLYTYNSDEQLYVGLPAEKDDWDVLRDHSITTYGGGAMFLTRSAIAEIPHLPCFSKQSSSSKKSSKTVDSGTPVRAKNWDVLIQDCIFDHTELNMHVLPGFYSPNDETYYPNIDSYESGQQPLLLHKPKERHGVDMNKAHLVTDVCGEACFMQRILFHDNWVVVNGVSISQYPEGIEFVSGAAKPEPDLDEEEPEYGALSGKPDRGPKPKSARIPTTKRILVDEESSSSNSGGDKAKKTFMTWSGQKRTWKLMDSTIGKSGDVWQAYVKKADPNGKLDEDKIDSVIVLIWEASGRIAQRSY